MLAVLMVTTSSPLNTGSINVYAAGTSVSTAAPANKGGSFKDKICGFFKKHKKTFIAAALTAAAITAGYFAHKKYKEHQKKKPFKPSVGSSTDDVIVEEKDRLDETSEATNKSGNDGNNDGAGDNTAAKEKANGSGNDNKKKTKFDKWKNDGDDLYYDVRDAAFDNAVGRRIVKYGAFAALILGGVKATVEMISKFGEHMAKITSPYGFFGQIYEKFKRKLNEIFIW